jgi:hypothetical protein
MMFGSSLVTCKGGFKFCARAWFYFDVFGLVGHRCSRSETQVTMSSPEPSAWEVSLSENWLIVLNQGSLPRRWSKTPFCRCSQVVESTRSHRCSPEQGRITRLSPLGLWIVNVEPLPIQHFRKPVDVA